MEPYFESFSDSRKQPQIPASNIAKSIILMPALELKSFLQLDQIARNQRFVSLIGSNRPLVASDSTFQRVLPLLDLEPIENTITAVYRQVVASGLSKFSLPSGKSLRLAAVDVSGFGSAFASVVSIVGKDTFPLDAYVFDTKGKELLASRALLSNISNQLGKSWCDLLLADGLYPTATDFSAAKELYGCDLLVKTFEESLNVIQVAKTIFVSDNPDVVSQSGIDSNRNLSFTANSISGLYWQDIPYPLTVVAVSETSLNPKPNQNPTETFFIITSNSDLSPNDLREAAHARWFIENNVFKRLNSFILSKRLHSHSSQALVRLIPLWLIGLSLLQLFLSKFKNLNWYALYGNIRITYFFLLKQLFLNLLGNLSLVNLQYG